MDLALIEKLLGVVAAALTVLAAYIGLKTVLAWSDAFADTDPRLIAQSIHRPRDWAVIQALRLLPYILIVVGVMATFASAGNLFLKRTQKKTLSD